LLHRFHEANSWDEKIETRSLVSLAI